MIFGKVFSYGSSCYICNNCIPPICKVGSIATASTIIPIPPNHCNNDRQTSVPSDKISKLGKGENELAIDTPDNTKHPANRRAEVKILN